MTPNEVAAAVAAADEGSPVHPWAVLLELAGVGGLSKMPAPARIEFRHGPDGGQLVMRFHEPRSAAQWCEWFGIESGELGPARGAFASKPGLVWRGWAIRLTAHPGLYGEAPS